MSPEQQARLWARHREVALLSYHRRKRRQADLSAARCLTVRQPWAELILAGRKDVENRGWATRHRGTLLIHAALALAPVELDGVDVARLPRGALVGVVDLVDCTRDAPGPWAEPGMWHWRLANPRRLASPIACRGALNLWCPAAGLLARVDELLA